MDISTQNYNTGGKCFVDDNDYSNLIGISRTTLTETTLQAIERINKEIATLQSSIKAIATPNSFLGRNAIKSYQSQIAIKVKQIDDIKANGTYCERNNNCPKSTGNWISRGVDAIRGAIVSRDIIEKPTRTNILEATPKGGGRIVIKEDIATPKGSGSIVIKEDNMPNKDDISVTNQNLPSTPIVEPTQDTPTDDSSTDTQTPVQMGMSNNTKLLIGVVAVVGVLYLLKK